MQPDIFIFLDKLEAEGKILPELRRLVQVEIEKYEGMRMVLESGTSKNAFSENLLNSMDKYLHQLKLVKHKLCYTHLALIRCSPEEDPELNKRVLELLRKMNRKGAA